MKKPDIYRKSTPAIRLSIALLAVCLAALVFIVQKPATEAQTVAEKRYKPELVIQTGHNNLVNSVAFSPNGKILASGSSDFTIKLWNVETGSQIKSLEGHAHSINSVAFSPDGKTLASGSSDNTIKLWNVETGQSIKVLNSHTTWVNSVVFSPDGKILAWGNCQEIDENYYCKKGGIKLWNVELGQEIKSLNGHTDDIISIAFSSDGKTIASGSRDKSIKLWNVETGQEIKFLNGHTDEISSVAFSSDGKTLASVGATESIKLWNVETGQEIKSLTGPEFWINSVAFSPDGKTLASGGYDNTIKLWNVETGQEIKSLNGHTNTIRSVVFSPDGKTIASGSDDNSIKLWDTETGQEIKALNSHTSWIYSIAFSPDGKTLASSREDTTIKLWNVETGQEIKSLTGHTDRVFSFTFSPDGKTLASGSNESIKLWNVETGQLIKSLNVPTAFVVSVAFSPDGKTIASGSNDNTIKLWNVESGKEIKSLSGHISQVNSVVFSPDGKTIALGSGNKSIKLWNVETGQETKALNGHTQEVNSIKFSPDGKTIASGSNDTTIKLWNVETGQEIKSLNGHTYFVRSVTFSPDGKTLASGSDDDTIKLWNVETGQEIKSLTGHTSGITSVAFSPDGKTIASGSWDATMKLWSNESSQPLMTLTALDKDDWVVTTSGGEFEASPEALKLMHYVVGVPNEGLEIISLEQLKSKSYTPGLLRDILAETRVIRNSEFSITLYPALTVEQSAQKPNLLDLKLTNRGGGIGRVEVYLNGAEIISDARRGKNVGGNEATLVLPVEIPKEKLRIGENKVEVIVWNAEGDVRSRPKEIFIKLENSGAVSKGTGVYKVDEQKKPSEINFYAIVAGVSDYAGDFDLRYAAKDAEDISKAINLAARRYFCNDEMAAKKPCERVHLRLLSTEKEAKSQFTGLADVPDFKRFLPNKQNFREVFAEVAAKAKPEDVVFIYMSGHGTAISSDEAVRESAFPDMYLYPTMDATSLEQNAMRNQSTREPVTINSLELAKWVFDIKAAKKVMIFDTCAAGAAQKDLIAMSKGTDEDRLQIRSLDRLRERTGFYILMGSASDRVSYEANEYRQGLLTYSLLQAMTVDTNLDDGRFLDVEKWFGYAEDKVENLAKGIGGVQKPYFFKGESKTFAVGRIEQDERSGIQIAGRVPLILQPELREAGKFTDKERLTDRLEAGLMAQSLVSARGEPTALNYVKATNAANGYSPRGFYTLNSDGTITAEVSLIQAEEECAKVKVTARKEEIVEVLIREIVKKAQSLRK